MNMGNKFKRGGVVMGNFMCQLEGNMGCLDYILLGGMF